MHLEVSEIVPRSRTLHIDSIRDEPEFQQLCAELQTNLAAQAKRVQDMKASGELSSAAKDAKTN